VNNAVEIKLHAKQRAGQMLVEGKKAGDLAKAGDNQRGTAKPSTTSIGITHHESSEFQKLAAVPERVLEKAITTVKERDGVLNLPRAVRLRTVFEAGCDSRLKNRSHLVVTFAAGSDNRFGFVAAGCHPDSQGV